MDAPEIAQALEDFVRKRFAVSPRDPRFDRSVMLFDQGYVDSVGVTEVLAFLETTYKVQIPDDELVRDEFQTIDGMAEAISRLVRAQAG